MLRPTPFDLVFRQLAQETFPGIHAALEAGGYDARDRDRFLMIREVVTLLRDLRPEEGVGEGIDQLAALVHHSYLYWDAGEPTIQLSAERLTTLLAAAPEEPADTPPAYYVQIPERKVWAEVIPGQPPEPLDGCFVVSPSDSTSSLRVLGVFGVHPEREGFSVVEATGPRPTALARENGTAPFAPVLAGGAAARLFSITGEEELLDLGWRTRAVAGEVSAGAGRWRA
jgi:hypothetical protein